MAANGSQKAPKWNRNGPKVSQRAPKRSQKGAKGSQKGAQREPKGAQRQPKGCQRDPKRRQRGAKGRQNWLPKPMPEKGHQKSASVEMKITHFGAIFGAKVTILVGNYSGFLFLAVFGKMTPKRRFPCKFWDPLLNAGGPQNTPFSRVLLSQGTCR